MEFDIVEGSNQELGLVIDWIPRVGMEFESEEDAWKFWVNYGSKMGFCVRKHFKNADKNGNVTSRGFVCSNEGFYSKKEQRAGRVKCPRAETRTGCKVRLGVKLVKGTGKYQVYDFVGDHNHVISGVPAQQETNQAGGTGTIAVNSVPTPSYRLNKRPRDHLIRGEIGNLLSYFHEYTIENPSFYHTVQLSSKERISNVFWADAKMRVDYSQFSDVITFDTTFIKNKKFRPLVVFFGFNHFREIIIFGAALIYEQKYETFKWLFETFLRTHNFKQPKTILTDDNPLVVQVVNEIVPESVHGFCTWHLMHDANKHLSGYNKGNLDLVKNFRDCMYEIEEEKEFEEAFRVLKKKSKGDSWLENIYKVKEKWANCFMKNVYHLGMHSFQTSEILNRYLNKEYLKSDLDMAEFFKNFEKRVKKKREREIESEFDLRRNLPRAKLKTRILLQMCRIYTPKVFEIFQNEYELYTATYIKPPIEGQDMNEYLIAITDLDQEESLHKYFRVSFDPANQTVSCNCKKFESCGIICGHALKVLDIMNIKLLPEKYILKRWTRYARDSLDAIMNIENENENENPNLGSNPNSDRYADLCTRFVKIACRSAEFEDCFSMVNGILDGFELKIEERIDENFEEFEGLNENNFEVSNSVPNLNVGSQEVRAIREKFISLHQNEIAQNSTFKGVEVPNSVAWMNQETRDFAYHAGFRPLAVERPSVTMPQSSHATNVHGLPNWLENY
ncbi:hypothetical protein LUZ60_002305 [Juncus effusus]|nr:hypothetical protein LUZ60_002305 [Juncus effusus]